MNTSRIKHLGFVMILLTTPAILNATEFKLAAVFTDHAILQRDLPVPIWGTAVPGDEITVEFNSQKKITKADSNGKWQVRLDVMPANEKPGVLSVSVSNPKSKIPNLKCSDILVGDVWLCSGQSNMGFNVKGSQNAEQEIAHAQYPLIRYFNATPNPTITPTHAVKGEWQHCSPQTAWNFSGVSYFFARELHQTLKIPIGLLHSSEGATPAEAWTRLEALRAMPGMAERAEKQIALIKSQEEDNKRFVVERAAWEEKYGVKAPPISETARSWTEPSLDTSDWKTGKLPCWWKNFGANSGGVFWLRKEFNLPETAAGKPTWISLNWVGEQYDMAFVNGVEVGRANDKPPSFYNSQRRYTVPGKLVKPGRNVVAVRVVSATEKAGVWQWGRDVFPSAGLKNIDDNWLMKVEATFTPLPPEAVASRPKANITGLRGVSSALYNGNIAPLIPFGIKGAIWYQGEANISSHTDYRQLLSLMINDWRAQWGQGDFPFIIQQLVNNGGVATDPNKVELWPFLREAQAQVSETVPNCGLAVGIELGDPFTIHPPNKQDVGKRLALVALEKTYGQKVASSGPRYSAMNSEGNSIRITFTHAKGLHAKGGLLQRFAIADASKKFVWADAKIEGESVIVSSPDVAAPVAVRYAWANNPEGCNLYNDAGLPAAPFRTDDWHPNR